jgi:hypothetical protein
VLRVRIHRVGPTGGLPDHLADERDPRAAAHQQDAVQILVLQTSAPHGAAEGLDGLPDPRLDHRFELDPGDPHVRLDDRQVDLDRRVGIRRERFLGPTALLAQPRHRSHHGRVARVELRAGRPDRIEHVPEERLIEIDAAEPLHAFWPAEELEAVL